MIRDSENKIKPAPKRRGRPPKKKIAGSTEVPVKKAAGRGVLKKSVGIVAEAVAAVQPAEDRVTRPISQIKYIFAVGRRKRAVARVSVYTGGDGEIVVNGRPFPEYFPSAVLQDTVVLPLMHSPFKKRVRIVIQARGGGIRGQADAASLGIARALLKIDENLRPVFRGRGLLTRDPREKERKKYGLKKARRAPQWQKR